MERLIDIALRNRLLVTVLAALVMGAGYFAYQRLPVDAFPDVSPVLVQVFTETRGLAPEEVEKFVTYPVESAMTGLPRVRQVRSVSNFGLSVVSVYFEDGTDIYFARQLVGEKLQEAREAIPEGFGDPQMGPISTGQGLVLYYYLEDTTGQYSLEQLRTLQDWVVKFQLQAVRGVTEVLGIGGFEKQFQVNVRPEALLRYDLTLGEIIEAVRENNLNVGAQFLEKNSEQVVVRSVGLAEGVADLESVVVKTVDGRPVYLRELADIEVDGAIRQGLQTRNGEEEVVSGMVVKLFGTNSSTVIARVEEKLREIQQGLPEGVHIVPYYEQKTLVQSSVNTVTSALLQGIGLVVAVLFVFIGGVRASVVVAVAIPFSVLFAVLAMDYFGISANLMSLGGLAIAIGMMVDGTIVMVENVDRVLRESSPNEPRIHAVGRACREVARPIVFAIGIIIIVFLPLFTLEGVEGKMFRPLAYTVALAMLGSLVFALVAAPVLSDLLMRRPRVAGGTPPGEPLPVRILLRGYRPLARFFVARPSAAIALAVGLLAGGAAVLPRLGAEFTPRLEEGDIIANLTLAPSSSLQEAKRNVLLAERRLLGIPEVAEVVSRIGRGEVGAHADPVNTSHMLVVLKAQSEWRPGRTQQDIEADIRRKLQGMPGVLPNLTQPIQLSVDELVGGVKAELAVKLYGDDLDQLNRSAEEIAAVVREVPGAADVQVAQMVGAPQLIIRPDREAVARFGLSLARVQHLIEAAVGGTAAGQVFDGVRRFDIYVRYQREARESVDAIRELVIEAPGGLRVPLEQVATIREVVGPREIQREDNQRFITVQSNVVDRDIGSFVAEAQDRLADSVELPAGYWLSWGGQFQLKQEADRRLAVVVPVTLALITLLLYMSFGSLGNTALILLNIPLALVGGVVALWISGQNLSVPASVGFIALFGIALENAMVLVTYLNQLLRDGVPMLEASVRGACLRLRPVLMTAATTALGLIPLLLSTGTGSEVQRPLATVVLGGLATSTVLTLLIIPALYRWFAPRPEGDAPAAATPALENR